MKAIWLGLVVAGAVPLLIAWILYPLVTFARGRTRPIADPPAAFPSPIVSVILATREAPEAVRARLIDLARSDYPLDRLEVILAIDGEPSGYADLLQGAVPVRVVPRDPPGGKATALNAGVRASRGGILVFADTYQRFEPEAVSRLVRALTTGPYGAVSGALTIHAPDGRQNPLTRYWTYEKRLRAAEARIHSAVGVTGAIYAMRRELWEDLPAGTLLDDLFVPMRLVLAGHRVGFAAEARATDVRLTSARDELRRKTRTLTGNLQLCAWLPDVLHPGRNPIWTAFVCHKLLRLLTPYCLLALALGSVGLLAADPDALAWTGGILALAVVALLGLPGGAGRRARETVRWGLALQVATVQAAWRGLRGRWDVWEPSREASSSAHPGT